MHLVLLRRGNKPFLNSVGRWILVAVMNLMLNNPGDPVGQPMSLCHWDSRGGGVTLSRKQQHWKKWGTTPSSQCDAIIKPFVAPNDEVTSCVLIYFLFVEECHINGNIMKMWR